jgi:hypothetical protein
MARVQRPIDDIPLSWIDVDFFTHNLLRVRGDWLSDILKWLHSSPPLQPSDHPLHSVILARKRLYAQGYLLYGHWDHMRSPSHAAQLEWLARTQTREGCWFPQGFDSGKEDTSELDYTIAATLSLIRAGHTSTQGQYASVVAQAVRWLEIERPLPNKTTAYALSRLLAEHYKMPLPKPMFDLPPRYKLKTFDHLRQWALVKGNAPIYPWDYGTRFFHDELGKISMSHSVQMAWMSVDMPRPITGI